MIGHLLRPEIEELIREKNWDVLRETFCERAAGEILEHHVGPALVLAVVEDLHDVRVSERRGCPRLALEPGQVGIRPQELDHHAPLQHPIVGEPDIGHLRLAQLPLEPVPACDLVRSHLLT